MPCGDRSPEELVVRRYVLCAATIALSLATAVAMLVAAIVLQPPTVAPSQEGAEVVHRFYAAVNAVIATGDTVALDAVVAPHFVEGAPLPGEGAGRSGLKEYLATLHEVDQRLRLVPEMVAAAGDLTVARVAIQRPPGPPVFIGSTIAPPPWGPVDVFRVANGVIVERWSHTDGTALIRPLAQASFDLPSPVPRVVSLDRLTLSQGATWSSRATGPHLLFLEEGVLHVQVRKAGAIESGVSPAHQMIPLSTGQSLTTLAGMDVDVTSVGTKASRVVVVSFAVPQSPGGAPVAPILPPDVAGQTLAGGMATDVRVGAVAVTLGQMILARGSQLSLARAEGPTLIAVDAGQLRVATSEPAWIWSGDHGTNRQGRETGLAAGDGSLLGARNMAALRTVGDDPVVVLVLTLRRSSDAPTLTTTA